MTDTKTNSFPYKTLIWAIVAILSIFLFKDELKKLISNAETVKLFGIEINASKEQMNKLQDSISNFESKITDLSSKVTHQQNQIKRFEALKSKLEEDLKECPEARNDARNINLQLGQIIRSNDEIKTTSDKIKKVEILQRTYNIKQK